MRNAIVKVTETETLKRDFFYQKMRKLKRGLIFCVEFRELSHWTRNLSPAERKVNVVTNWATDKMKTILWFEMKLTHKWPFYDYFWAFFCHLYVHLSQNWASDGHFEVLHGSKSQLVQKLWRKMHIFSFSFFFVILYKNTD